MNKSQAFYNFKHIEWSNNYSCGEYLIYVEKLLVDEEKRFEDVLFGISSQTTIKKLLTSFDEELIKPYKNILIERESGLNYMMVHGQFEVIVSGPSLNCRYTLF